VIKHINPLSFLETQDRFTIEFTGLTKWLFYRKTQDISEIVSLNNGNALVDRGIDIAVQDLSKPDC
jgi:hypothetical protein